MMQVLPGTRAIAMGGIPRRDMQHQMLKRLGVLKVGQVCVKRGGVTATAGILTFDRCDGMMHFFTIS